MSLARGRRISELFRSKNVTYDLFSLTYDLIFLRPGAIGKIQFFFVRLPTVKVVDTVPMAFGRRKSFPRVSYQRLKAVAI